MLNKSLSKLLLDRTLAKEFKKDGEALNDDVSVATKNRKAVHMLEQNLERCRQSRAKREELKEATLELGSSVRQAARTDAEWALVPTTTAEFRLLQKRDIVQIMTSLTFREPTFGECYWRIPSSLSSHDCKRRLTLLQNALDDGLRRAKGETVVERVNLKGTKRNRDERDEEEEMDFDAGSNSSSSSSSLRGDKTQHILFFSCANISNMRKNVDAKSGTFWVLLPMLLRFVR